jgi:outer membrane protein TolC
MKKIFFHGTLAIVALMGGLTSYAGETLSLEEIRSEVLSENIDIKIQYEKYYQAQQNISAKYGELLPSLDMSIVYAPTTYTLLNALVPTPSDWFVYKASQQLAKAQDYVSMTLRLNILEGLTNNFTSIKFLQELLDSMGDQREILATANSAAEFSESLGLTTDITTFETMRALLEHDQQIYLLKALIASQKESLLMALGRSTNQELELAELAEDDFVLPENYNIATEIALQNSPEIVANRFIENAANLMVKSQKYSFLSFRGIGFDYPALLSIERSKVVIIRLQGEKIRVEISNQMKTAYTNLDILEQRMEISEESLGLSSSLVSRNSDLLDAGVVTQAQLDRSKVAFIVRVRAMITLNQSLRLKRNHIKRLLGVDATILDEIDATNVEPNLVIENTSTRYKKNRFSLKVVVPSSVANLVSRVSYSVQGFNKPFSSTKARTNFSYRIKARSGSKVNVAVILTNGETINLTGQL